AQHQFDVRPLARAKLLGQLIDQFSELLFALADGSELFVAWSTIGVRRHDHPACDGGSCKRFLRRRMALRYRIPAAASLNSSARAVWELERCSKCRIKTISRSTSSSVSTAAWNRNSSSWCVAAAAGVNSRSTANAARSKADLSSKLPWAKDCS